MDFKIIFPTGYQEADVNNGNLDINVVLPSGKVYWGCLFTINNIKFLMDQDGGHVFWATDMVVVKDLSKETIRQAISELIRFDHLNRAFTHIGHLCVIYPKHQNYDSLPNDVLRILP